MRADLVPGGRFPDLELPDHAGNVRRLSALAGGDPLVLQFYRGLVPQGTPVLRAHAAAALVLHVVYGAILGGVYVPAI